MYGRVMYKSVNAARLDMLRVKCGDTDGIDLSRNVDLGQFPPCLNALQQHIRRANYQTCIWKAADKPRSRAPQQLMVMVGQLFMEKFNLCCSVVH